MKDVALNEVMKELNWKEKIVVKLFSKTILKIYNMLRVNLINTLIN